jgi:hypothetical protein
LKPGGFKLWVTTEFNLHPRPTACAVHGRDLAARGAGERLGENAEV